MIYLIHNTNNNTLKIGQSKNPKKRLKTLLTATADNLILLKTIQGTNDSIFKKFYKQYHIVREWYKYSEHIIKTFSQTEKRLREFNIKNDLFGNELFDFNVLVSENPDSIIIRAVFCNKKQYLIAEKSVNEHAQKIFNLKHFLYLKNVVYRKPFTQTFYLNNLNKQ